MHTGLAAGGGQEPWSIAHNQSALAVAAESAEDVAAGVAFAAKHNLRLSVKGTGHDWFGRSGSHPSLAGGLLMWTHKMKRVTWHDSAFVAERCAADSGVDDAVTLEAGLQFADFYPEAEKRGRLVNGGTCTSVGVGGCTLGGCFGPFSQKLGPAASNVLEAKVVLANGTLVTASKCSHPDLFWALRGGGAGFGVVTEWTMRTLPWLHVCSC
jgi:FAD/FMN-containing dehydrogenase